MALDTMDDVVLLCASHACQSGLVSIPHFFQAMTPTLFLLEILLGDFQQN